MSSLWEMFLLCSAFLTFRWFCCTDPHFSDNFPQGWKQINLPFSFALSFHFVRLTYKPLWGKGVKLQLTALQWWTTIAHFQATSWLLTRLRLRPSSTQTPTAGDLQDHCFHLRCNPRTSILTNHSYYMFSAWRCCDQHQFVSWLYQIPCASHVICRVR